VKKGLIFVLCIMSPAATAMNKVVSTEYKEDQSHTKQACVAALLELASRESTKRTLEAVDPQHNVFCLICEKARDAFVKSKHVISRKHSFCPDCKSKERQRHLWYFMLTKKKDILTTHTKMLYWAPSFSIDNKISSIPSIEMTRADINPRRKGIERLDITDISFPDNTFDVIICSHVLEHVLDDLKAMRELYRVLKEGGYSLILVPLYKNQQETYEDPSITEPEQRLVHFDQKDHVRRYGFDLEERLARVGFTVKLYLLSQLSDDVRMRYGFAGYDDKVKKDASRGADIFYCEK